MAKIVTSISIGIRKTGLSCDECLAHYDYSVNLDDKGVHHPDLVVGDDCPLCQVAHKQPTPSLTQSEINLKKSQMKARIKL